MTVDDVSPLSLWKLLPLAAGEDRAAKTDVLYKRRTKPDCPCARRAGAGDIPFLRQNRRGLSQAQVNALDVAYDSGNVCRLLLTGWRPVAPEYRLLLRRYCPTISRLSLPSPPNAATEACFARGELTD